MVDQVRKVVRLLTGRERFHFLLLILGVVCLALLELASIGSVFPFLTVAADPAQIRQSEWLTRAYDAFGFGSPNQFLVGLGVFATAALVLSNSVASLVRWAQFRFTFARTHALSIRLLRAYLNQPYAYFLGRNSASLGSSMLHEVGQVTSSVLMPLISMLARGIVALAIVVFLFVYDPLLAMVVTPILGGAYAVIYWSVRRKLGHVGHGRVVANRQRFQAASEVFGAIKDVKLLGRERAFLHEFRDPSYRFARHQATAALVGQLPRYALEALAFGGILLIAVVLILRGGGMQGVIPVLGLYAFAGYRLMPALQEVFLSLTQVRFGSAALDHILEELENAPQSSRKDHDTLGTRLKLRQSLKLEEVRFKYPGSERWVLEGATVGISANTAVGIVGTTGSGKTTLVDVILGLLQPQSGQIKVDDTVITTENLRAWQNTIGYVPQHIYLSDDTVARNIAFGIPQGEIDMEAVERAAQLAQIHDFVTSELPKGYDTVVGERGIRLSGGQRQRIGIARALYHDPALLVFDEATSALDEETEQAVMSAVASLAGSRTIILIAHRWTTLKDCDAIYSIADGKLTHVGTYEDLALKSVDSEGA